MNQKSKDENRPLEISTGNNKNNVAERIVLTVFTALVLVLLAGLAYAGWDAYAYKQVESFEDAGTIVGASYTTSFSLNTSAIRTTSGTYVGVGFMQAVNGHDVRIEMRKNGDRALCDVESKVCIRLLGK